MFHFILSWMRNLVFNRICWGWVLILWWLDNTEDWFIVIQHAGLSKSIWCVWPHFYVLSIVMLWRFGGYKKLLRRLFLFSLLLRFITFLAFHLASVKFKTLPDFLLDDLVFSMLVLEAQTFISLLILLVPAPLIHLRLG